MPIVTSFEADDRRLRPYSGMTDGQLKRGEGFDDRLIEIENDSVAGFDAGALEEWRVDK